MNDKPFEFRLVNGLQGDPAVFVSLRQSGEAILFDLGSLDSLSHKDILRVRQVFVSHAHMDHFIGFDRLLRINVPHRRQIQIFGPPDFIERVRAKLLSYTWNLIDAEQIRFEVFEIHPDDKVYTAILRNTDGFSSQPVLSSATAQRLLTLADGSLMSAVLLDHRGIWSVAYRLSSESLLKVRTERLKEMGLKAGPWLGELQQLKRRGLLEGSCKIDEKLFDRVELAGELFLTQKGRSLVYLTDLAFHQKNLASLFSSFAASSDGILECSFSDADYRRAVDKAHLSTRQSALIARGLGLQNYSVFHISSIYGLSPEPLALEAQDFFDSFPGPGQEHESLVTEELRRISASS
ncbi:MAG: hypothetical protein NTX25_06955 [Proteobacteria bacterium]|nr:hypothetical protein [Pseudomonadota bacterium]